VQEAGKKGWSDRNCVWGVVGKLGGWGTAPGPFSGKLPFCLTDPLSLLDSQTVSDQELLFCTLPQNYKKYLFLKFFHNVSLSKIFKPGGLSLSKPKRTPTRERTHP
jgi:hypothetical protein